MNVNEVLKLENQLCFALYSANRMMTKTYKPLLDKYGITYPQYLVLLALFEENNITVKRLGEKLLLDSGTLTPLLKRMEKSNLVKRERSSDDERKVFILLTTEGESLKEQLVEVPLSLCKDDNDLEKIVQLREQLKELTKELRKI